MKRMLVVVLFPLLSLGCASQESADSLGVPAPAARTVQDRTAQGASARTSGRAFEVEDYYRTAFVGGPALSPDGQRVVFSVRRYDLEADETWSEIWIMNADGSDQRRMTQGKHSDGDPMFTPDGSAILFGSNRAEGSQLFLMPVDGGEPRQLTHFAPGVSGAVFSPDGKYLAVSAEVHPECGVSCKEDPQGKLDVHVADELLYRHWTSWSDGKKSHVFLVDATSGDVLKDLTPGPWEAPTFSLGGDRGYCFSPDGKELCFVSNHEIDQAESTNADLWATPIEGELSATSARNLTDANDGWDGAPLYSPDGRWIGFISQETPGYESDLRRLALLERSTGQVRYLTSRQGFDDGVGDLLWTPDGALLFNADRQGRNPLFRQELSGGEPRQVLVDATLGHFELSPDGQRLFYGRRAVGAPPEIYTASSTGNAPTRLTRFNAELEAEVDIRPAEELWVEGEGGYKIHVFLVKPHDFDPSQRYPLILNVHGGPQSQWMDSYRGDWQVYPGKGYVVAFANPTGSTGYGQPYTDAIAHDYGGRVFRDLMKVTDALEKLPYVDPRRMGSMGWSYGGYMMMWFQGHTDRFACQAAMMGLYDMRAFYGATEELWFPEHDLGIPWENPEAYEKWSPSSYVKNFKTPALVISGELDYRVPYTQSLQYFTALQKRGVPSRLVIFPNAGHWPSWREMAFYYNAHLDWFHRYLGGEPAPHDVQAWARGKNWPKPESAPGAGAGASPR